MPFARGNARGPAEKRAVSAIYFGTRGNRGNMRVGEKLSTEEICGESALCAVYFITCAFSTVPRPFPLAKGIMNTLL